MKCYLKFMSKRSLTCEIISFFCNFCQFKRICITNFAQSQFLWMVDCRFNGLDTSLYKVLSWLFRGLIKSELGIRIQKKKCFYCTFRSRTIYTRLKSLITNRLPEQNFHALFFISKPSFTCCGSLINFVIEVVFVNCRN